MELSLDPFSWYWCWLVGWKYHIIVEFQVSMQKQSSIWIKTLLWVPKYPKTMQFSDPWERLPRFFASFTEPDNTIISGYNMYLYDIYIYVYICITKKLPLPQGFRYLERVQLQLKAEVSCMIWKKHLEKAWIKDWFPDSRKDQRFEEGESSILRCHDLDLMIDKWCLTKRTTFTRFMSPPYKDSLWERCQKISMNKYHFEATSTGV